MCSSSLKRNPDEPSELIPPSFTLDVGRQLCFFWDLDKGLSCLIDLSVKVRSTLTVPFALQPPLDLLCPLFVCPSRAP